MPVTNDASMESDQEYKIEDAPERSKEQEELDTPSYMDQLDLDEDQIKRLGKEIFAEYHAIKKEYDKEGYIQKWKSLDNQYEGKMADNANSLFNLHKPSTKVKCGAVIRYLKKAFLKSDPKYSITPRPEYAEEGGVEVCERQEDYLDYKLDTGGIPFDAPLGKTFKNGVVKNGGVLKLPIEIQVEARKRPETYIGNPLFTIERVNAGSGEIYQVEGINLKDLEEIGLSPESPEILNVTNDGLDAFLLAYPDGRKTYPKYVTKLEDGKRIEIMVEYDEIVYNDPLPKSVLPENFFVRTATEGYDGLKVTKLIVERTNYNWYDLKKNEEKGKFQNVDELMYMYDGKPGKKKAKMKNDNKEKRPGYENESFDILECTYYFEQKEGDDATKIVCYFDEESEKYIGGTNYPYYSVDCIYVPFFALEEWPGFWQPGVAEYMTDTNIAENSVLNFTLEAGFIANTFTPVTKNAEIIEQFLDKTWTHGIPLEADPGELDSLQKYMKNPDTGALLTLLQTLTRVEDDISGVSSGMSGKESDIDPSAPASKTIALLRQSGVNIEEYINTMLSPFNRVSEIILKLTHQMSEEGRKFRPRPERVVGDNPFSELTREDMVARTNIQSQAFAFNFDKHSQKQEDLALYSTVRQEPLIARNPEAVYIMLKNMIKGWSPKWKHQVDLILPPIEEFKQEQLQIATMAVAEYLKQEAIKGQATGKKPVFDPSEVLRVMSDAMARAATPPSKEIQAKEAKQAEKAQEGQAE